MLKLIAMGALFATPTLAVKTQGACHYHWRCHSYTDDLKFVWVAERTNCWETTEDGCPAYASNQVRKIESEKARYNTSGKTIYCDLLEDRWTADTKC